MEKNTRGSGSVNSKAGNLLGIILLLNGGALVTSLGLGLSWQIFKFLMPEITTFLSCL